MDWHDWVKSRQEAVVIKSKQMSLNKISPWRLFKGIFCRFDGLYFSIRGYFTEIFRDGEIDSSWGQPLLKPEEPIHGWVILAAAREEKGLYVLFSLKAEPGWPKPQLAPTFQASKSKLIKNPAYPRRALADRAAKSLIWNDGGIWFNKRNYVGLCWFDSREAFRQEMGDLLPDERWFSIEEYKQALAAGEISDHLLQTIGCLA